MAATLVLLLCLTHGPWSTPIRASFYSWYFQGRQTASGQLFDQNKLTAASRTIPLGTSIKVVDLRDGDHVDVLVNDRGPYAKWHHGRYKFSLDLSRAAAKCLGISWARGWDWVVYKIIKRRD